MDLTVTRAALAEMLHAAEEAAPEECCGILLGRGSFIERAVATANVAPDRRDRFEIDPQALVDAYRAARAGGPDVIGYYHSHPRGPAEPSAVDSAMAARDGRVWAIVGQSGVTFWRDGERGFAPLSYVVKDR